jgi:hypothetical protein
MQRKLATAVAACAAAALAAPVAAPAHDGPHHGDRDAHHDGDRGGHHRGDHRHHRGGPVVAGTVSSVDATAQTVVVHVTKATRRASALEDQDVTISLAGARLKVADTNADGTAGLADVAAGDTVFVKFRRGPATLAAGTTLQAKALFDRTHAPDRADFKHDH